MSEPDDHSSNPAVWSHRLILAAVTGDIDAEAAVVAEIGARAENWRVVTHTVTTMAVIALLRLFRGDVDAAVSDVSYWLIKALYEDRDRDD